MAYHTFILVLAASVDPPSYFHKVVWSKTTMSSSNNKTSSERNHSLWPIEIGLKFTNMSSNIREINVFLLPPPHLKKFPHWLTLTGCRHDLSECVAKSRLSCRIERTNHHGHMRDGWLLLLLLMDAMRKISKE